MSLFAKITPDHTEEFVHINKRGEVVDSENHIITNPRARAYWCPSCNGEMHFVSAATNGRTAHFSGRHSDDCDIGFTSDAEGGRNYAFESGSIEDFLDGICEEDLRVPAEPAAARVRHEPSAGEPDGGVAPGPVEDRAVPIHTVRQLFHFMVNSDPNDIVYGDKRVKDIYCGPATEWLYTKYISGTHLVYCEYNWHDDNYETFYFRFPSKRNTVIKIFAHIKNPAIGGYLQNILGNPGQKVLILAEFESHRTTSDCTITSRVQIVPLSK